MQGMEGDMLARLLRSTWGATSAEYALILAVVGGIGAAGLALKNAVSSAVSDSAGEIVADSPDYGSGGEPAGGGDTSGGDDTSGGGETTSGGNGNGNGGGNGNSGGNGNAGGNGNGNAGGNGNGRGPNR